MFNIITENETFKKVVKNILNSDYFINHIIINNKIKLVGRDVEWHQEHFNIESFAIRTNRDVLYKRINARVDKMIEAGLIDEVKKLFKHKNLNPLNTVGYKEIFEFIEKKVSLEQSIEKIKQNTRRYAKRQITWLKNKDYKWIDSDIDLEEFIKMINSNN